MIDGVLYVKVVDPKLASYGVENAMCGPVGKLSAAQVQAPWQRLHQLCVCARYAVVQLAQTTMRSELGKITLDKTFEERDALNHSIVKSIQCALVAAEQGSVRQPADSSETCALACAGRRQTRGACSACGMRSVTSPVRAFSDVASSAPAACMPPSPASAFC